MPTGRAPWILSPLHRQGNRVRHRSSSSSHSFDIILCKSHSCTTTPVVRKKPVGRTGKRIEEARSAARTLSRDWRSDPLFNVLRATFGSAADQSKGPPALASATPWITPRVPQRITASASTSLSPADDINNRLALTELTGMLAAHLLDRASYSSPCVSSRNADWCDVRQFINMYHNLGYHFSLEDESRNSSKPPVDDSTP